MANVISMRMRQLENDPEAHDVFTVPTGPPVAIHGFFESPRYW